MAGLVGQMVGGCQVLDEIGQGGMGVIYRARQVSLDRIVAMKVLAEHLVHDAIFVQRFQREARAIARVNHPNILQVYDVGNQGDIHYMIMELVDGSSLAEQLETRGTLPWQEATNVIRQGAEGLDAAGQAGIIHRDVKPDNLMITKRGVVKVSDFGLAKEVESSMTATDAVMGTPAYMSPEQCDGKDLDGRSDIYSLGGTFYRILTGRLPFEAETAMSMMYRHKHEPLVPAKEIVPSLPQVVSDVISKMMHKKVEDRYQTMAEVAQAIDAAVKRAPVVDPLATMAFDDTGVTRKVVSEEDMARATQLRAEGDERMQRGDVVGAAKLWHEAMRLSPNDPDTAERLAKSVRPEVHRQKEMGEKMLAGGQISEAARCFRNARDMAPDDDELRARLQSIEEKLKAKRGAVNELRQEIATGHFQEAVARWDELPQDMREESLAKQIDHLRATVIPAATLGEQGDALNDAGRIDDALATYQKILEIDETNAKARQGIKTCQAKLHRIDMMTKEGYDYNLRQDFEKAVGAWEQIFKIYPGHPQATKLITEARYQWGIQIRNKEGGLSKAVENWQKVLEYQPGHPEAEKYLAQDSAKLSKLNHLNEEMQAAKRAGKDARSVKLLRQMSKLAPTDTRIAAQLKLARKKLSRGRSVRVLGLFLLGCVAIGGTIYLKELWLVRQMEKLIKTGKQEDALLAVQFHDSNFPEPLIMKEQLAGLRRSAKFTCFRQSALDALEANDLDEAIGLLRDAKDFGSPQQRRNVDLKIAELNYRISLRQAEEAVKAEEWQKAINAFGDAAEFALQAKLEPQQRDAIDRKSGWHFYNQALRAKLEQREADAKNFIRLAAQYLRTERNIQEMLRELDIDFERGASSFENGSKALSEGRWAEAVKHLAQAYKDNPGTKGVKARLDFSKDNLEAEKLGMVLVFPTRFSDVWGRVERKAAFMIDRYEYPNRPDVVPQVVSYEEAEAICKREWREGIGGFRLPSAIEWKLACGGRDGLTYCYGETYDPTKSHTDGEEAKRSGDGPTSASPFGAYDMCGNLAEWATQIDPEKTKRDRDKRVHRYLYGGHFKSGEDSKTESRVSYRQDLRAAYSGFRCVRSLVPAKQR